MSAHPSFRTDICVQILVINDPFSIHWRYNLRYFVVTQIAKRTRAWAAISIIGLLGFATLGEAQNPSGIYSPVHLDSPLPYRVEIRPYAMGAADVPTLHSFAAGEYDGKWLFLSGRTNGLHGFDAGLLEENFPPQSQNREVWVIDLASRQSWHRALDSPSAGLTEAQVLSLSNTNNQFYRSGETLYVTGGYGVLGNDFGTHDTLSAIDLPGLGDWVINGIGSAADHVRQIHDPIFRVTGGAMYAIDGRTHLAFGQDFQGVYSPFSEGTYTEQVRSFNIVDDGTNLSIENAVMTAPVEEYHRRDLNVVPVIRPDGGGGFKPGLVAFSGVFTPGAEPWSVPIELDENGNPSMDDPNDPATFQQAMNNYHSSKIGLFSAATKEMHELLFGGISLNYLDPTTQTIETDYGLPFVNDVTSIVVDASGNYSQHHLGFFPELYDTQNRRLRLGANSEFLLSDGVPTFDNGVIDFDALAAGENSLGYIYGGIIANAAARPQQSGRTLQRVEPYLRGRAGSRARAELPRTRGHARYNWHFPVGGAGSPQRPLECARTCSRRSAASSPGSSW